MRQPAVCQKVVTNCPSGCAPPPFLPLIFFYLSIHNHFSLLFCFTKFFLIYFLFLAFIYLFILLSPLLLLLFMSLIPSPSPTYITLSLLFFCLFIHTFHFFVSILHSTKFCVFSFHFNLPIYCMSLLIPSLSLFPSCRLVLFCLLFISRPLSFIGFLPIFFFTFYLLHICHLLSSRTV